MYRREPTSSQQASNQQTEVPEDDTMDQGFF